MEITNADRTLLAEAFEEVHIMWLDNKQQHVSFPDWAQLARTSNTAFIMCALRAIARAR